MVETALALDIIALHKICNMKFRETLTDCWAEGANAAAPAARVAITASFILILFI